MHPKLSDARRLHVAMLVLGSALELAGILVLVIGSSLPLGATLLAAGLALSGAGIALLAQNRR